MPLLLPKIYTNAAMPSPLAFSASNLLERAWCGHARSNDYPLRMQNFVLKIEVLSGTIH